MRVISCDSRQFFQEMTIGTAVPTQRNCRCTSFYSVQIYFNYSVGDFEKEAIAKIDELFLTNDYVVLVGSGLYQCSFKGF
jgi:tRNA dimethylallyltransferase